MARLGMQKAVLVYLVWLGILSAVILAVLSRAFPIELEFIGDETLYLCLVEAELVFIYFVWPLFIPATLVESNRVRDSVATVLLQVFILVLFSIPLALLCQNISNAGGGTFVKANALVVASAALVGSLYVLARTVRLNLQPYYYFFLFLTQAGAPYVYFLVRSYADADPRAGLMILSPFWMALNPESAAIVAQIGLAAAMATGLAVAAMVVERRSASWQNRYNLPPS